MSAFGDTEASVIVDLVDKLFGDDTASPMLSLVAQLDDRIVGHVLFTAVTLEQSDRALSARILAPLGVIQGFHGKGVGSCLIESGLGELAQQGVDLVFVLGHPEYYSRFGFRPAGAFGLNAPYPIPAANADAWMVCELIPGLAESVEGTVKCSVSLDRPELWRE